MSARMPDLLARGASHRHTEASALESLVAEGLPESRICFRFDGTSGPAGLVVGQSPAPGTALAGVDKVILTISGFGLFYDLPFGLRLDVGSDEHVSTSTLMGLFDSEFIRFRYWRDEAPAIFGIGPSNHEANRRWLNLFGLDPGLWEQERHFALCCLVPHLHRMAGTEFGIRLVLEKLLNVEVAEFRFRRDFCQIAQEDRNRFRALPNENGEPVRLAQNLRLGSNAILGTRLERTRSCELRIGPLTLTQWRNLISEEGKRRVEQALTLCMPLGLKYSRSYVVGDPKGAIELGCAERNSVLGVNSHLNRPPTQQAMSKGRSDQ